MTYNFLTTPLHSWSLKPGYRHQNIVSMCLRSKVTAKNKLSLFSDDGHFEISNISICPRVRTPHPPGIIHRDHIDELSREKNSYTGNFGS